jgi:hypothetical protein
LADVALGGDAGGVDDLFVGDPGSLDMLAGGNLGFLDGARARDLLLADVALGGDPRLADGALVRNTGLLDVLPGLDLSLLCLRVAGGSLTGDLRTLDRALDLDLALLLQPAASLSRSMSRACRSASRLRVRMRIIESCSMSLRSFRRSSISSMIRVRPSASKRLDGLKNCRSVWSRSVSATDSSCKAVLVQRLRGRVLHALDIDAALLVHLLHGHLGRDGAKRRDELAERREFSWSGWRVRRPRSRPPPPPRPAAAAPEHRTRHRCRRACGRA